MNSRFPLKNKDLLEKWVKAVRLEGFTPTPHTVLCSQHFTPDCYSESTLSRSRLKTDAVPTIFKFPSYYQKRSTKRRKLDHIHKSVEVNNTNIFFVF